MDEELELYRAGALTMFWSHAARQPWQNEAYYSEQRQTLRPNAYRRLHQNEWVTGGETFIDGEEWDANVDETLLPAFSTPRYPTVIGVDCGVKHDNAAAVEVGLDGDRLVLVTHRIWRPTPSDPLDIEMTIEAYLRERHRLGRCLSIVCDPYQLQASITRLQKAGLPIRELPQTQSNTMAFSQSLFDALKARALRLYTAADLRQQAMNAVALESGRGWRLAKEKSSKKIDAVVALAMACYEAIEQRGKSRAVAAAIMPAPSYDPRQDPHSPSWWGNRYYGIRPGDPAARWALLTQAPQRWEPSQALLELREENAREERRLQQFPYEVIRRR